MWRGPAAAWGAPLWAPRPSVTGTAVTGCHATGRRPAAYLGRAGHGRARGEGWAGGRGEGEELRGGGGGSEWTGAAPQGRRCARPASPRTRCACAEFAAAAGAKTGGMRGVAGGRMRIDERVRKEVRARGGAGRRMGGTEGQRGAVVGEISRGGGGLPGGEGGRRPGMSTGAFFGILGFGPGPGPVNGLPAAGARREVPQHR